MDRVIANKTHDNEKTEEVLKAKIEADYVSIRSMRLVIWLNN